MLRKFSNISQKEKYTIEENLTEDQFGFGRSRKTREAILSLRKLDL